MTLLLSILCIVLGAAAVRRPDLVWEFQHFLTVKNGEPSRFFLISMRAAGILMILSGGAALVSLFFW